MSPVPTNLKHKPILVLSNYEAIDGKYAGNSDAKGLSIGLAQWNDRGSVDISAKVWRFTGEKWSRQSEELPLHRVLDLAILITQAMKLDGKPQDLKLQVQGADMEIDLCSDNKMLSKDIDLLQSYLADNATVLNGRFSLLAECLRHLGY